MSRPPSRAQSAAARAGSGPRHARASAALFEDRFGDRFGRAVERQLTRRAAAPALQLDDLALEALGSDGQAVRDADQLGVLELDAWPLVARVEDRLDAALAQRLVEPFARLGRLDVLRVQHRDDHLEGRHRHGPHDPVVVVALLDDRRHHAPDADAVGAHLDRAALPPLVERVRAERLAVAGAELEDVADLDGLVHGERGSAQRARLAGAHLAQIEPILYGDVALEVDAAQVMVVPIGAGGHAAPPAQRRVRQHAEAAHAHRTEAAGRGAERGADLLRARGAQLARAGRVDQLLLRERVVAA